MPGSPYTSAEGAITAARVARERGVPFLGHLRRLPARGADARPRPVRHPAAAHAEYGTDGTLVIVELECSLAGHEGGIVFAPGR